MIYLIRHGQTVWNAECRKQGYQDSPLTWEGIRQASEIAATLGKMHIDIFSIFASPLSRVTQFSYLVLGKIDSKLYTNIVISDLLKECGFGIWEGMTDMETKEKHPDIWKARENDKWNYSGHGIESYEMIFQRAKEFLCKYETKRMLIFTHEMISKVIRGNYLNMDKKNILDLAHPQNVIYRLENGQCSELSV